MSDRLYQEPVFAPSVAAFAAPLKINHSVLCLLRWENGRVQVSLVWLTGGSFAQPGLPQCRKEGKRADGRQRAMDYCGRGVRPGWCGGRSPLVQAGFPGPGEALPPWCVTIPLIPNILQGL